MPQPDWTKPTIGVGLINNPSDSVEQDNKRLYTELLLEFANVNRKLDAILTALSVLQGPPKSHTMEVPGP
jgi:hypothetical protein